MSNRDLTGKNIVITGANTGIGRVTARRLAERGAHIIVANRSRERSEESLAELTKIAGPERVTFVPLDLGDLDSVRTSAQQISDLQLPIHVLINNAGLAAQRGITKQGFELQFGVNHLGHFLFTELLLPRIQQAAPARIVIVASKAHYRAKRFDFDAFTKPTATVSGFPEYAVSKLANVLHARELSRRLSGTGVTVYSLHPGVIASDIWRRIPWPVRPLFTMFMKDTESGSETSLYCATDPAVANESGKFYMDKRSRKPAALALDNARAKELWERSEAWVASHRAHHQATA